MQWLKRIRITLAVIFFLAVSSLFVDFGNNIPIEVHTFLVSLQFVPSLIRTFVLFSAASIGLFVVLSLTLLYGRIYCSTICPLGILQDGIIRIAKMVNRRRWFRFKKPNYTLHYALFVLITISFFSGSVILLNLLEPFSSYGRILSDLISPSFVLANNALGYVLDLFGLFILFKIPFLHVSIVSILTSLSIFSVVVYLAYYKGRLFCNLLCPAGALLGLLSRVSLFKIVIDENNCKDCGLCERVCKARCIKSGLKEIDFAACIGCFNCLEVCPTLGMSYKPRWRKSPSVSIKVSEGRRRILKTSILPAIGFIFPELVKDSLSGISNNGFDENQKHPISPPGSIGVERFSKLCTACHLCISSCPTQVLYPSIIEYGIAGILQPKMNYAANYCNYDCVICGHVCPTGAILPLDLEIKKQVQIGKADFVKDDCIVVTKKKDCGACSEHCPTKAVHLMPYGKLMLPEVTDDLCIGCGACEHACPVQPKKAIYVKANMVHQKAKKPELKKIDQLLDSKQEFPF